MSDTDRPSTLESLSEAYRDLAEKALSGDFSVKQIMKESRALDRIANDLLDTLPPLFS